MAKQETITLKELLSSTDTKKIISTLSFEQGLSLLEELVESVETGKLSLEESIQSYEKGVALIAQLRELLSGAEVKLKELQEK